MTGTATETLINSLAADARPVRRLKPPMLRCGLWLGFAAIIVIMLGISHGVRPDLARRFADPVFALRVAGAGVTGVLAALSVFLISLPDRSRKWALLPVPAVLIWLSTIGYGCLTAWMRLPADGMRLAEVMSCLATLVLTGSPLSFALVIMMRHTRPLSPGPVALNGALAVAAITAMALSLFHDLDATVLILLWNLGTAALFLCVAGLFNWRRNARQQELFG